MNAVTRYTLALALSLALPLSAKAQLAFQPNQHLYSETANPRADIVAASTAARRQGKRILLEFGGNWCGDCQVLDFYYHQPPNAALLDRYYVLVHVDIGHMDHNVDVATRYHVPHHQGRPRTRHPRRPRQPALRRTRKRVRTPHPPDRHRPPRTLEANRPPLMQTVHSPSLNLVIPTGAQRSGGTRFSDHPQTSLFNDGLPALSLVSTVITRTVPPST